MASPRTFEEAQRRLFGLGESPNTSIEDESDLGDELVTRKFVEKLWDNKADDIKQDLKQHFDAQIDALQQHIDTQLAAGLDTLSFSAQRGHSREDGGGVLTTSHLDAQLDALKKHLDTQLAAALKTRSSSTHKITPREDARGESRSSGRDLLALARHLQHATGMAERQPLQKSSLEDRAQDESRGGLTGSRRAVDKTNGSKITESNIEAQPIPPVAHTPVPIQKKVLSSREETKIADLGNSGESADPQPEDSNKLAEEVQKEPTPVPKTTPRPNLRQLLFDQTRMHGHPEEVPKSHTKDSSLMATAGAALSLIRSPSRPSKLIESAAPGNILSASTSSTMVAGVALNTIPPTTTSSRNDIGVAPEVIHPASNSFKIERYRSRRFIPFASNSLRIDGMAPNLTHPSANSSSGNGVRQTVEAPAFATRLTSIEFPMPYHKADINPQGSFLSKSLGDQHDFQILRKTAASLSVDEDDEDQIILSAGTKKAAVPRAQSSPVDDDKVEYRRLFSARKGKAAIPKRRSLGLDEDDDEEYQAQMPSKIRKTVVPKSRSLRSDDKEDEGHVSSRVRKTEMPKLRFIGLDDEENDQTQIASKTRKTAAPNSRSSRTYDEDEDGQPAAKKQKINIVTGRWITIDIGYKSPKPKYIKGNLRDAKLSDTLKELIRDEDLNTVGDHRRISQEANWNGKQCWMAQYILSDSSSPSNKPYTSTSPCGICLQRLEEEGVCECCYFGDKLNLLHIFRVDRD